MTDAGIVALRPTFTWRLRSRTLPLGARTCIAGVLNVTPDSFSDGGNYLASAQAIEHAHRMLDAGADLLDIGGESTRPGDHEPVSAQQEIDRVLPVIEALRAQRPDAILSIDTYKALTAQAAIAAGAEIVNDVSGFLWDAEMAATCARLQCGVVLMHARGRMAEWRSLPPLAARAGLPTIEIELRERVQQALAAGVAREHIVVDPGLGFGKNFEENYPVLAGLSSLHALGYPLLIGASRKSFLLRTAADCIQDHPSRRAEAALHTTLAAHTAAILAGAHLLRVHDVAAARQAASVADAIRAAADAQRD